MPMRDSQRPEGCAVTPRNEEEPREKPCARGGAVNQGALMPLAVLEALESSRRRDQTGPQPGTGGARP